MTQLQFNVNFSEIKEMLINSDLNDVLKSILILVLNEFMEKERDDYLQVNAYERSENRRDYRNGYYEREFLMNIGSVPLRVPRTRNGEFATSAFEKYNRSDQSFLLSLVEMVVNGVSTRKVSKIVEQLCGETVSKSFVSNEATSSEEARRLRDEFINKYEENSKIEKAINTLENGFEDSIQYLNEPENRQVYIRSTNSLERLNQEVRRRERVIRIFPNTQSAFRLIGSILMDYDKEQEKKRRLYRL